MQILRINKGGNKLNESIHIKEKEEKIIEKKKLYQRLEMRHLKPLLPLPLLPGATMMVVAVHIYLPFVDNY